MPPGRFIVFEGLDGSGTTTQVQLVTELLQERGVAQDVYQTREPTTRSLGAVARLHVTEEITLNERSMAMAFSGDRLDHVVKDIAPQVASGAWVVCDRYYLSTLGYQGARIGAGDAATPDAIDWRSVDDAIEWLWQLNRFALRPDVMIFLDVPRPLREQRTRRVQWHADRYDEQEVADVIEAVHERAMGFLEKKGHVIRRLDASRDAASVAADAVALILDQQGGAHAVRPNADRQPDRGGEPRR